MNSIVGLTLLVFFHALPSFAEDAVTEVGYKPTLVKEKKIKASFVNLKPMVRTVGEDSKFALYEGLPLLNGDPEELDPKLDPKKIVKRFGFNFYNTPNKVEAEDIKNLKSLIKAPKSFKKFGGFKFCGGFHPDYSLVWGTGDEAVEIHICFGCHELKAFRKGVEVYCDIPDSTYPKLKQLLQKYRKQRVEPAAR